MFTIADQHARHSILRERIVEHWLVGEIMRRLWVARRTDIEVLRSEFDRGGYDLMLDLGGIVRHVQLKTSRKKGSTSEVTVSLELARRHSGCVVWAVVEDDLLLDHFKWFGGLPDQPLPDVSDFKIAKHAKANAQGVKAEKANFRKLPVSKFDRVEDVENLLDRLFSTSWRVSSELGSTSSD